MTSRVWEGDCSPDAQPPASRPPPQRPPEAPTAARRLARAGRDSPWSAVLVGRRRLRLTRQPHIATRPPRLRRRRFRTASRVIRHSGRPRRRAAVASLHPSSLSRVSPSTCVAVASRGPLQADHLAAKGSPLGMNCLQRHVVPLRPRATCGRASRPGGEAAAVPTVGCCRLRSWRCLHPLFMRSTVPRSRPTTRCRPSRTRRFGAADRS